MLAVGCLKCGFVVGKVQVYDGKTNICHAKVPIFRWSKRSSLKSVYVCMVFTSVCAGVLVNSIDSIVLVLKSLVFSWQKSTKKSTTGRTGRCFSDQVVESIHGSTTATAAPSDGSSADRRAGGKWTAQGRSKTWRWWKTSGIFHRFFYMVDIWWIKIRHEDIFCMKTMDYR